MDLNSGGNNPLVGYCRFRLFGEKLILELDGPHHEDQREYDRRRDEWLRKEGYRVLRVDNDVFFGNENKFMEKSFSGVVGE